MDIPIVKGLDGTLAIRYDDYSDFGGTTNSSSRIRWQPIKDLLLRGSYGTGFRAPTLSDLYYPVVLGSSAQFNDPVTGQTDLQVNEYTGGNPALKPETSTQWGLGVRVAADPAVQLRRRLLQHQARGHHRDAVDAGSRVGQRDGQPGLCEFGGPRRRRATSRR